MKKLIVLMLTLVMGSVSLMAQTPAPKDMPRSIYGGMWRAGHVQGIALDSERKYVYYSFTTMLVKTDLQGRVIGTVTGLLGHLGCIDFNEEDGRLYGSLEYKNDAIGKGIMRQEKSDKTLQDGFYVAIFDVEKITREGMSAEKDGIMTTVFLPTILADYKALVPTAKGANTPHRFGCSGFDGLTFGPEFGKSEGRKLLTIAYGIYRDKERSDNDYQVLLQYDTRHWAKYEAPLSQDNMHRNGPAKPESYYFVYTGNTTYGVQNLEYDAESNLWFMAVYKGKKEQFANFSTFVVDGSKAPRKEWLQGVEYLKKGKVLSLLERGVRDAQNPEIYGWRDDIGAKGLCAIGDGYFYAAYGTKSKQGQDCDVRLYRFVGGEKQGFERVE
ncbi:MAG: hypothetical protein J6Q20_00030 [Alistipes sp.]|nr:hypothetical protein [Alistipes sp.]